MKTRPFHILRGNEGNQRPQAVIFFDTETKAVPISKEEDQHILKLGWACFLKTGGLGYERKPKWFYFTTPQEFWSFVDSRCYADTRVYLVAHNVAFDLRIVMGFSTLPAMGWQEDFAYDKGLTTILRYKRGKQSLEILSTTNFFGISLKRLGSVVGLEKKEVSFANVSDSELSSYCRRDVEILVKAWGLWIDFLDKHNLGSFRRTISSQAFASYRHRFMTTKISIHNNMEACRFERESYRGGRTECFKVGSFPPEKYFYLDVNGMYAYQMMTQKYPYKLCGFVSKMSLSSLINKLRNFACIARVVVTTEEPAFVIKHNKRNVYPVGTFEAVLTTPDLKYAAEHNMIKEVKEVAWYKQDKIFTSYTTYFTKLKERYEREGNTAFRAIAKLFINALYGKFGQTDEKPKSLPAPKTRQQGKAPLSARLLGLIGRGIPKAERVNMGTVDVDTGEWLKPKDFPRYPKRSKVPEETYDSFPAIVSHVTAYARHYLWMIICKAGRKNAFYCDTDSVVVNQAGLDNLRDLIHPTKPGYLKIEKQGTNLTIHAPKDYVIGNRVRQKGIRKNAVEIESGVYRQDQFLGLAGAKRRGNDDLVTIRRITKTLHREIKTGVVGLDGWVIPFRLPL